VGVRGDLLQGMRRLRRAPGSALVAIVTLGLGMALGTVQYTPVHKLLFDRLPFDVTGRLVTVRWSGPAPHARAARPRPQDVEALGRFQRSFEAVTGFSVEKIGHSVRLGDGRWVQKIGLAVLPGFLSTVGVRVKLGRPLAPEDHAPGAPPVLVVSHHLWQDLGADPAMVGQTLYYDRQHRTVVGVAEPHGGVDGETFWAPLALASGEMPRDGSAPLQVLAVVQQGTTLPQVNADIARLDGAVDGRLTPAVLSQLGRLQAVPARDGLVREEVVDFYRLMLAVSVLVLLCACANVASILLARALDRSQELAIRAALGATRRHVVWQMVGEVAPIGLLAAAVGLVAAVALADVASVQASWTPLPPWVSFAVDWRIAGTVTVISLLATALAALVPALRASTVDVQAALNEGARTATAGRSARFRSALLIGQIAISASVLLVALAAGLTARDRAAKPLRIDPQRYVTAGLVFPRDEFRSEQQVQAVIQSLERRLSQLGGGLAGSVSTRAGLGQAEEVAIQIGGENLNEGRPAHHAAIAANYFSALGVPVLEGRAFRATDDAGSPPVAIVDSNFVQAYWPGQAPLDRSIAVVARDGRRRELRVVGVVPSLHMGGASNPDPERPGLYTPLAQLQGRSAVAPFLTGPGGPALLQQRLMSVIRAVDPDRPPRRMRTFRAQIDEAFAGLRNLARLYGLFGVAALVLSAVGLYGLMALTVQQRTREIGTRVALGATRARILRLFLRRCAVYLAVGLPAGAGFGAVLVSLSERRLGLLTGEVFAFVLVASLLTACALLATIIPAARAAGTSPMVAMRKP
jgi:predicted permease